MCRRNTQIRNKRTQQNKNRDSSDEEMTPTRRRQNNPPTPSRRSSESSSEEDSDHKADSKEGGKPNEIRNKRERSKSPEVSSEDEKTKRLKANTTRQVIDGPKVGVAEPVGALEDFKSSEPGKFCDLYKSRKNGLLFKFIRKSGSHGDIIYLAGHGDNCLYEYNTQTEKIEEHQLSKFHEKITIFSDDYVNLAKRLLLGDSTPKKEMKHEIVKVNKEGLITISVSLNTCVGTLLKSMRKDDKKTIGLGANSKYGIILKRAFLAILDKYGLEIDYVAAVQNDTQARDRLHRVKLRHATEKWEENMGKDNRMTAKLSATWLMSNNKDVQMAIESVKANYHKEYSISAIREAYASAICDDKDYNELTQSLAEARFRWAPITYGSETHLAVKTSSLSETEEWGLFNTLIHEALHSVEHPNFTLFLNTHIPSGLQEDIKEGIVDYITNQIWIGVLNKLAPETGPNKTKPSDKDFTKPLQINMKSKGIYNNNYFEYKDQVAVVMKLISKLDAGDEKLKTAYFGGNLGAFLPKLKDTEEKKS